MKVPSWFVNLLIGAAGTILLSWAAWGTNTTISNAKDLAVTSSEVQNIQSDIVEIKASQLRIEKNFNKYMFARR